MYKEKSLEEFLENVSKKNPIVPSGGSVLALCGALSVALSELVVNTTIGKKGYEEVYKEMEEILERLVKFRNRFLEFIDKDANSYNKVMKALKMPKDSEDERENRLKEIDKNYKEAVNIPLELCENSLKILELIRIIIHKGNSNAAGDAYTAALLLQAVIKGSINNIQHNIKGIIDEEFVKETNRRIDYFKEGLKRAEIIRQYC